MSKINLTSPSGLQGNPTKADISLALTIINTVERTVAKSSGELVAAAKSSRDGAGKQRDPLREMTVEQLSKFVGPGGTINFAAAESWLESHRPRVTK